MADVKGQKPKKCGWLCKAIKVAASLLVPPLAPVILIFDKEITEVIGQEDESTGTGDNGQLSRRAAVSNKGFNVGVGRVKKTPLIA